MICGGTRRERKSGFRHQDFPLDLTVERQTAVTGPSGCLSVHPVTSPQPQSGRYGKMDPIPRGGVVPRGSPVPQMHPLPMRLETRLKPTAHHVSAFSRIHTGAERRLPFLRTRSSSPGPVAGARCRGRNSAARSPQSRDPQATGGSSLWSGGDER